MQHIWHYGNAPCVTSNLDSKVTILFSQITRKWCKIELFLQWQAIIDIIYFLLSIYCFSEITTISYFELSQGSAATYWSYGGKCFFLVFVGNLLGFPAVKELWKSVKNWQSYRHGFGVLLFWGSSFKITPIFDVFVVRIAVDSYQQETDLEPLKSHLHRGP